MYVVQFVTLVEFSNELLAHLEVWHLDAALDIALLSVLK